MSAVRRLLRYGAVSIIATVLSLTILGVLVTTRVMSPGWANVVATAPAWCRPSSSTVVGCGASGAGDRSAGRSGPSYR